ncbi:S1 family peptidase [Gordonia phthalatica]|uniref:Peptidase S1 n=1 Tax=Gordonia phthalatica TaxID=1136941 RepID=A0A0N9MQS5_9ACTN|nr:S1 family peptidase [Gordonia phthalatica]ALG85260.1 peptidase S1 [Gordonia phthalatica]
MKAFRRALLAIGAAAIALSPAAVATAAPAATVGGGSGIVVNSKSLCTVTTVGHDRGGRLVALTAGHCGNLGDSIRLERNRSAGVVGRIVTKSKTWDVAVVQLDSSRVRGVRSVGKARINGVGTYPAPLNDVCKSGRTTGFSCGPTLLLDGPVAINYVCAAPGDSGGPIIKNGRVVGMLNAIMRVAGPGTPAIECISPAFPVYSPMVATKMTDILKVLKSAPNAVGSGFRTL